LNGNTASGTLSYATWTATQSGSSIDLIIDGGSYGTCDMKYVSSTSGASKIKTSIFVLLFIGIFLFF